MTPALSLSTSSASDLSSHDSKRVSQGLNSGLKSADNVKLVHKMHFPIVPEVYCVEILLLLFSNEYLMLLFQTLWPKVCVGKGRRVRASSQAAWRKRKESLGQIELHLGDVSDAFFLCDLKKFTISEHHVFSLLKYFSLVLRTRFKHIEIICVAVMIRIWYWQN